MSPYHIVEILVLSDRDDGFFFFFRSQHFDSLQQADNAQKQPLKDTTNTSGTPAKQIKLENNNEEEQRNNHNQEQAESSQQDQQQQESQQQQQQQQQQSSRSLQCLETLAQKAGIRIHDVSNDDCKYDIANTLLNLDRSQHEIKQEYHMSENMSDIKNQQQQVVSFTRI